MSKPYESPLPLQPGPLADVPTNDYGADARAEQQQGLSAEQRELRDLLGGCEHDARWRDGKLVQLCVTLWDGLRHDLRSDADPSGEQHIEALLSHPLGEQLERLWVLGQPFYRLLIELLARLQPPTLRSLSLGKRSPTRCALQLLICDRCDDRGSLLADLAQALTLSGTPEVRRLSLVAPGAGDALAAALLQRIRAGGDAAEGARAADADLLNERGDPRGVLLAHQLHRDEGELARRRGQRARFLLRRKRQALLGELVDRIDVAKLAQRLDSGFVEPPLSTLVARGFGFHSEQQTLRDVGALREAVAGLAAELDWKLDGRHLTMLVQAAHDRD